MEGPIYVETSALAKLYLPEPGSEELIDTLGDRRDLQLSELTITELVSAAARLKREGILSDSAAGELHRTVLEHSNSGHYLRVGMTSKTHREAERLLLSLAETKLRAADSLHLALALSSEARTLASYDLRLRRAASSLGMALVPA